MTSTSTSFTYSYSPKDLVESFRSLKTKSSEEDHHGDDAPKLAVAGGPDAKQQQPQQFVVAAVQLSGGGLPSSSVDGFWDRAQEAVRIAATEKGANLILLPELFLGPYFCQSQEACLHNLAIGIYDDDDEDKTTNFVIHRMQQLARQYSVVLPISFFERQNNTLYNTVVMIDADGTMLGQQYRKTHIPDGTGYQEKFYFSPGDTGFQVWQTRVGKVGVAICWDQWFPEPARAMALMGADIILYPTAIGSEPQDSTIDSSDHWQRAMQGHAASNMVPVVASNRYGTEILLHDDGKTEKQRITFYGRTFITDNTGAKVVEVPRVMEEGNTIAVITSVIDPEANRNARLAWGLFRDRRPDLYGVLLTKDGSVPTK